MTRYLDFHRLSREPFDARPGFGPVLATRPLRAAVAWLSGQIHSDVPVACVHGPAGIGRSSVARVLPGRLVSECRVARIFDPRRHWPELRLQIADQLVLDGALCRDSLVGARTLGDRLVVVVDAAELADAALLAHLDELLDLEGPAGEQLAQVVLFVRDARRGEDDAARVWRWLSERRAPLHELDPLSPGEVPGYIQKRLEHAGHRGQERRPERGRPLFSDSACLVVHRHARGLPRRVNVVCDAVLREAARRGTHEIDARLIADTMEGVIHLSATGRPDEAPLQDPGRARLHRPSAAV